MPTNPTAEPCRDEAVKLSAREFLAAEYERHDDSISALRLREGRTSIGQFVPLRALERALARTLPPVQDDDVQRVKPVATGWCGSGKYTPCIGFEPGTLYVYAGGYENRDGDGYFVFRDDDLDFEQDDGPLYRIANVPNSELIELRDWLNKLFPLSTRPTTHTACFEQAGEGIAGAVGGEEVERLIERLNEPFVYWAPNTVHEAHELLATWRCTVLEAANKLRALTKPAALPKEGEEAGVRKLIGLANAVVRAATDLCEATDQTGVISPAFGGEACYAVTTDCSDALNAALDALVEALPDSEQPVPAVALDLVLAALSSLPVSGEVERWKVIALSSIESVADAEKDTDWGSPTFGPTVSEALRAEYDSLSTPQSPESGGTTLNERNDDDR